MAIDFLMNAIENYIKLWLHLINQNEIHTEIVI